MKSQIIIFVIFFILILSRPVIMHAETTGPTPTPVNYTLPYPGLLPDNPFYFLKALRDRILAFFISSPIDIATFDIQEADKRVLASYMLVTQENKVSLSESTFSKGENYFTDALSKTYQAKGQGINIQAISAKLLLSNQKHIEVLYEILGAIPKKQRYLFSPDLKRLQQFAKEITSLQIEK